MAVAMFSIMGVGGGECCVCKQHQMFIHKFHTKDHYAQSTHLFSRNFNYEGHPASLCFHRVQSGVREVSWFNLLA